MTPQVCWSPALTWVNAPAGGVAWPAELSPQQATVLSVLTPQVWPPPALTWVNVPAGGVALLEVLYPQQATVPSVLSAQVWVRPALTRATVPGATRTNSGCRRTGSVGLLWQAMGKTSPQSDSTRLQLVGFFRSMVVSASTSTKPTRRDGVNRRGASNDGVAHAITASRCRRSSGRQSARIPPSRCRC